MPVSTVPLNDEIAPDLDDWRDYKVGERIDYMGQQPKDLPVLVLEEMAKWLKSEGAPCAAEMAEVSDTLSSPSLANGTVTDPINHSCSLPLCHDRSYKRCVPKK